MYNEDGDIYSLSLMCLNWTSEELDEKHERGIIDLRLPAQFPQE